MPTFTEERCKELMEHLGQPNSKSLYSVLMQVANEVEQETTRRMILMDDDEFQAKAKELFHEMIGRVDSVTKLAGRRGDNER